MQLSLAEKQDTAEKNLNNLFDLVRKDTSVLPVYSINPFLTLQ